MQVRGTIYAPSALVVAEASGGTITTDQVIAFRFQLKGDAGSLTVAYEDDFLIDLTLAGLVE